MSSSQGSSGSAVAAAAARRMRAGRWLALWIAGFALALALWFARGRYFIDLFWIPWALAGALAICSARLGWRRGLLAGALLFALVARAPVLLERCEAYRADRDLQRIVAAVGSGDVPADLELRFGAGVQRADFALPYTVLRRDDLWRVQEFWLEFAGRAAYYLNFRRDHGTLRASVQPSTSR